MLAKKQLSKSNATLPSATITFHLNTAVYRRVNGELVKSNDEKIPRGSTYPLVAIENDIAELTEGRFVKDIAHQKPTIYYGVLEVLSDGVTVCSRNGFPLRKLQKGQNLKVRNILTSDQVDSVIYAINKHEYISSVEAIRFISGYLMVAKDKTIVSEGRPIILKANQPYAFSEVYQSKILLTDFKNVWCSIDGNEFTIKHALVKL